MSKKVKAIKSMVFYARQDPEAFANLIAGVVTDVVTTVEVYGATSVVNDTTKGATSDYVGQAFSQYGDEMADAVTLSLKETVSGVTISGGVVTIANTVEDGTKFIVKGAVGTVVAELEVTVTVPEEEE